MGEDRSREAGGPGHRQAEPFEPDGPPTDPEVAHVLAGVGIAVCVGVVVVVWVAGALYNAFRSPHHASHGPRERTRSQPGLTVGDGALIGVAVVCAGLAIAGRSHFDGLVVGAWWVRVLGLAMLVASTVFTLWARFSLGTMWSVAPRVEDDHRLRTHGPYAVTRHPIRPSRSEDAGRGVVINAVWDGAQPGNVLRQDRFLGPIPNPEVIIIGRGPGRRVGGYGQ
jgi:hypothetical protein